MAYVCPHCGRTLVFSGEPPAFCGYCGQRLAINEASTTSLPPPSLGGGRELATPAVAVSPSVTLEQPPTTVPTRVGSYRLLRPLGSGGMGTVYEAVGIETGQRVAVKLLATNSLKQATALERFRQEGRLASRLTHPRCVFVYAADEDQGQPFIVMELMPGSTLKDQIERHGPLPPIEAVERTLEIVEGLQEAHRLGFIHRDVKPSNCFLREDGTVKVGDFGLSKLLTPESGSGDRPTAPGTGTGANHLTGSGMFLGTFLFASPEQLRGEEISFDSDVYSVCATLYYLLTGRAPHQHDNPTAVLARAVTEAPPPPRQFRPEIPRALEKIILRGLERDRSRRWPSLDELHDALASQVPGRLTLGGQGKRVAAFLLDAALVALPILLPLYTLAAPSLESYPWMAQLPLIVAILYFALLDGLGGSPGKWIVGLRVCRTGTTEPPGAIRAGVRAVAFLALLGLGTAGPNLAERYLLSPDAGLLHHVLAAVGPPLLALGLLVLPMRRRQAYRGVRELISGTGVLELPPRERRRRLEPRRPDPFAGAVPVSDLLPARVGPYRVSAVLRSGPEGHVLLGEHAVLGRRVLLWVQASERLRLSGQRHQVTRPTRPRTVGHGSVEWPGSRTARPWEAFVVPPGAPLTDAVAALRRLDWAEARPVMLDLAEELTASLEDGTLPTELSVEQIWVTPDGRSQLMDVPTCRPQLVPPGSDEARCLTLTRQAAELMLEGQARPAGEPPIPVQAPVPRYAARLLDRLAGRRRPYDQIAAVRADLWASRYRPARVTRLARTGHLAVQALWLAAGVIYMFLAAGLFNVHHLLMLNVHIAEAQRALEAVNQTPERQGLYLPAALKRKLENDSQRRHWLRSVELKLDSDERRRLDLLASLHWVERSLLQQEIELVEKTPERLAYEVVRVDRRVRGKAPLWDDPLWYELTLAGNPAATATSFVLIALAWAGWAGLTRGGVTLWLFGLALVNESNGQLAGRSRCVVRSLLVWGPLVLLLVLTVFAEAREPANHQLHATLWLTALLMMPAYVLLALLRPERALHDRATGLRLVPR